MVERFVRVKHKLVSRKRLAAGEAAEGTRRELQEARVPEEHGLDGSQGCDLFVAPLAGAHERAAGEDEGGGEKRETERLPDS